MPSQNNLGNTEGEEIQQTSVLKVFTATSKDCSFPRAIGKSRKDLALLLAPLLQCCDEEMEHKAVNENEMGQLNNQNFNKLKRKFQEKKFSKFSRRLQGFLCKTIGSK